MSFRNKSSNIHKLLITILPLIFLPLFADAEVAKFVFTTNSQSVQPGVVSDKITISAQDASGNSADVLQTTCIDLKVTSSSGEFSSSNTNWSALDKLTMSKNSANRSFYFKDQSAGSYTITAQVALRPESVTDTCTSWPIDEWSIKWTAQQNIVVGSVAVIPQSTSTQESNQAAVLPVGEAVRTFEPKIFADAGEDKTVTVGADFLFEGKAYGINEEPLSKARYLWSFGDGSTAEGNSVIHNYKYVGEYVLFLSVSSGEYSAVDRIKIKVVDNKIAIAGTGPDFVKISNGSNVEINLSGWHLRKENITFRIPETTIITAGSVLTIPQSISGIGVEKPSEAVELLYPNGSVARTTNFKDRSVAGNSVVTKKAVNVFSATPSASPESVAVSEETPSIQNLDQTALVLDVSDGGLGNNIWLYLTMAMCLITATGVFVFRKLDKEKAVAENPEEKPGYDFEIEP